MEPISGVDRLILLLRQRLRERAETTPKARNVPAGRPFPAQLSGPEALAALEGVSDRQFERALVQRLLHDYFGDEVVNDPTFHTVVNQVTDTLQGDPELSRLLERAIGELKAAAKC